MEPVGEMLWHSSVTVIYCKSSSSNERMGTLQANSHPALNELPLCDQTRPW